MRTKLYFGILLVIASLAATAGAQSNTFTYQGRLTDNNLAAVGTYEMQFRVFDAAVAGNQLPIGTPVTLNFTVAGTNPVTVSNGAFTVQLNFGNGVFTGADRWLEISVRKPSDPPGFTLLTPRQPITSSPYAIKTINANAADSVTAACVLCITDAQISGLDGAKVTGTVANATNAVTAATAVTAANALNLGGVPASGYLPTAGGTITGSLNVNGIISGNGSGITNISAKMPWAVVSGNTVQALPNHGYFLEGQGETVVTLPTSPTVGDVLKVNLHYGSTLRINQNAGQQIIGLANVQNFTSFLRMAVSDDGTKLVGVAANRLWTSTDSGVTWFQRDSIRQWQYVASSSDGTKLVATVNNGQIYTSTDSGLTWFPRDSNRFWAVVASSSDGTKLVATVQSGQIYTSTDSGVTWFPRDSNRQWQGVASSSDGTKLVATVSGGQIYTSTDSGLTWFPRDSNRSWSSVASSSDGTKLVATVQSGQIYTSTDSGVTWFPRDSNRNWNSVASSSDGTKLAATASNESNAFTSTDSGLTWTPRNPGTISSSGISSSADGTILYTSGFALARSTDSGVTWTALHRRGTSSGTAGYLTHSPSSVASSIEMVYIGNGRFAIVILWPEVNSWVGF